MLPINEDSFFFSFLRKIHLFILWLCWVFVAACGFSLVAVGAPPLCSARLLAAVASLVACRPWGVQASLFAAHSLSSCGLQAREALAR